MTIIERTVHTPGLGAEGKSCPSCGAPLAGDQRYCLNCGDRCAEARLPFMEVLRERDEPAAAAGATEPPAAERPLSVTPGLGLGAAGLLALVLGIGVLIGNAGDDAPPPVQTAAAPAPVVNVTAPAGGAVPAAAGEEFQSDWPDGERGWTVQLQALPKDGTDVTAVNAAKTAAEGKGAPDVGALDSDDHDGLRGGEYVIYSGVFAKKAEARRALRRVKEDFPDAKVIRVKGGGETGAREEREVSESELEELENQSPEEFQRRSRRLPDDTALPGEPPPADNREPGGGSDDEAVIE